MGSSVVTPEDVLESLMNDGTIDAIRLKIINQLKANEELKNNTITMVEQSKVLNTPGAERQTKRELFDSLRRELETPVLEKASKSVWELILDNNGLGREINEMVEKVYCRLSGVEPPLIPSSSILQPEKDNGKEKEKEKEKEEKENSESSSKKRSFSEMSMLGAVESVEGSGDPPAAVDDSGKWASNLQESKESINLGNGWIIRDISNSSRFCPMRGHKQRQVEDETTWVGRTRPFLEDWRAPTPSQQHAFEMVTMPFLELVDT